MEIQLNENFGGQVLGNAPVSHWVIQMEYQEIGDSINVKIKWKEEEKGLEQICAKYVTKSNVFMCILHLILPTTLQDCCYCVFCFIDEL